MTSFTHANDFLAPARRPGFAGTFRHWAYENESDILLWLLCAALVGAAFVAMEALSRVVGWG